MTPELKAYLQKQQVAAMNAEAIAQSIEMLMGHELGNEVATAGLVSVLIGIVSDLNEALDSVNLRKVDDHAAA